MHMPSTREADLQNDPKYDLLSDAGELDRRLSRIRASLGEDLVILGHHYQSDQVLRHVDLVGDSLKLSRLAAERKNAKYIVFCGVDFMAETADILSGPSQKVFLPDLRAGCPMAAMAPLEEIKHCWDELIRFWGEDITPITYINSSVELKAFCGLIGGAVCTSSNAEAVMRWALGKNSRILFLPDQHLGRNTADALGLESQDICLWSRRHDKLLGATRRTKVVLWDGHCPVHNGFTVEDIEKVRHDYPGINVVVHPECPQEVLRESDAHGSTEKIIECVAASPPGSQWAVGTDNNLVRRLDRLHQDKTVIPLAPARFTCADMARINRGNLLSALESILEGKNENRVKVVGDIANGARLALERMLALT